MKKQFLLICALFASICGLAIAAEPIPVAWDEYDEVAEGTSGFIIKVGKQSGNYTMEIPVNDPAAQTALIDTLKPGRYYSALVAVYTETDGTKIESKPSNEISFVVKPNPPKNYR